MNTINKMTKCVPKNISNDTLETVIEDYVHTDILTGDGTISTPSIAFDNETDLGFYRPSSGKLSAVNAGAEMISFETNKVTIPLTGSLINSGNDGLVLTDGTTALTTNNIARFTANDSNLDSSVPIYNASGSISAPAYSFTGDTNSGLSRVGADEIALSVDGMDACNVSIAPDTFQANDAIKHQWTFIDDATTDKQGISNLTEEGVEPAITHSSNVTDSTGFTLRGAITGDGVVGTKLGSTTIDPTAFSASQFTMMMWVKLTSSANDAREWVGFSEGGVQDRARFYYQNGNLSFLFDDDTNYLEITKAYSTLDEWIHIAISFDGSSGSKIYVNGVVDTSNWSYDTGLSSDNWSPLENIDTSWFLYYLPSNTSQSQNYLSNVIILNTGLSATEILHFYNQDLNSSVTSVPNSIRFSNDLDTSIVNSQPDVVDVFCGGVNSLSISNTGLAIPLTSSLLNSGNDGVVLTDGSVALTTNNVARLTATDSLVSSPLDFSAANITITENNVKLGNGANSGSSSTSVGRNAGGSGNGANCVAIGNASGELNQTSSAVAVGLQAGQNTQGIAAVAIGAEAGKTTQGSYSIAVGNLSGTTSQHANSIIISANSSAVNSNASNEIILKAGTTTLLADATKLNVENGLSIDSNEVFDVLRDTTWTPTLGDGTNNFTLTTAVGKYQQFGNIVKGHFNLTWSSQGSASGDLEISLPQSADDGHISLHLYDTLTYPASVLQIAGECKLLVGKLYGLKSNAARVTVQCSDFGSTGSLYGSFFYTAI